MDAHINVAGVWKALNGLHVNVSGVWKEVQKGHINVGGVWKQFYNVVAYALSGEANIDDLVTQPTVAIAGIRVNADGTIDKRIGAVYTQIDSATDWGVPNGGITGNEEFFCTDNNANLAVGSDSTGALGIASGGVLD